ncbi:Scr1 family TA system antitoxin-like transcriptional regulator, partial [Saccharothrix coeruleofusca]
MLRTPVGDEEICAEQIRHLREPYYCPNITFRVVADGRGLTG